ncbi:hypothetical protein [Burkholderia glumae]|nr:hypothetical protein [Burkholderia glumae]KHJ61624.1 hypothetical protein NCPPB3923_17755 [Burkholderia glumae]QJP71812.1 hypothetical protein HJC54_16585 [Burkholderia glumae]
MPVAAGLLGAPALWSLQMLGSQTLAATVCDAHGPGPALAQRLPFGAALAGLAAVAWVLALGCTAWVARAVWRGERDGSRRFLARCGLLAALGFVAGLVFTGMVSRFVAPCLPW